jgi:type II secretory pathway pseudopilin PulG
MNTQKHKQLISNSGIKTFKRQAGVTLIEAMISLALSLIVTSAMVVLMANSMGTSTRIIQMSQLSDELRNAMSMMTRDVRRANYSANAIFCYGNAACGDPGGIAEQAGDIQTIGECLVFNLDRNFDGDSIDDEDGAAGFRRVPSLNEPTVFVIEMWTGGNSPNCAAAPDPNDDWIELTDPGTVNITVFDVNHTGPLPEEILPGEPGAYTNRQREIQISLEGQLTLEEDMGNIMVTRRIEDVIYVRNDFIL